jgi:hypothetical protein
MERAPNSSLRFHYNMNKVRVHVLVAPVGIMERAPNSSLRFHYNMNKVRVHVLVAPVGIMERAPNSSLRFHYIITDHIHQSNSAELRNIFCALCSFFPYFFVYFSNFIDNFMVISHIQLIL